MRNKKRLVVGVSGATGAIYGVRILEILSKIEEVETHLVLTKAGRMTIQVETPYSAKDVEAMADVVHDVNNVGASISSGSFRTEGMVIAPCSMKSMGSIAFSRAVRVGNSWKNWNTIPMFFPRHRANWSSFILSSV